jgi:hypothetical protein
MNSASMKLDFYDSNASDVFLTILKFRHYRKQMEEQDT